MDDDVAEEEYLDRRREEGHSVLRNLEDSWFSTLILMALLAGGAYYYVSFTIVTNASSSSYVKTQKLTRFLFRLFCIYRFHRVKFQQARIQRNRLEDLEYSRRRHDDNQQDSSSSAMAQKEIAML